MNFYELVNVYLATNNEEVLKEARKMLQSDNDLNKDFIRKIKEVYVRDDLYAVNILSVNDMNRLLREISDDIMSNSSTYPYVANRLHEVLQHVNSSYRKTFITTCENIIVIVKLKEHILYDLNLTSTMHSFFPTRISLSYVIFEKWYNYFSFLRHINKRLKKYKYTANG